MLGGQTNCQSVQTVISDDGEDNKTSPDVLNQRPAGSSSGEQLHWNTGNSCKHNDFIVSSSDVPGRPPVRKYHDDIHQDTPSLHPDTSTVHTVQSATPARDGQGMEDDISLQRSQTNDQAVGRKRNVKKIRVRSPGMKKELRDCVHDKDGRCGTHGAGQRGCLSHNGSLPQMQGGQRL